jgi:cobalt transporter subunit CbtA
MTGFRGLLFIAAAAGLAAGLAVSVVHAVKLWPMIAAAELLETHAGDHAHGGSPAGALRVALSVLFNIAAGIGFGLVLNALMRLWSVYRQTAISGRDGLLWGAAGFAAFALAPSVGLPPELPGMAHADLPARQVWWVAAAVGTLGAIALWMCLDGAWRWVAVLPAALPHLAMLERGQGHSGPVPPELAAAFATGSVAASAVFWLILGGVSAWAHARSP